MPCGEMLIMTLTSPRIFAVALVCMICSASILAQPGSPASSPFPDLSDIASDTRRAIFVEVSLDTNGIATLLDLGVTNVPPDATDEDPPLLLLQGFNVDDVLLVSQNSWDPRFEYQRAEDGDELVVLLDEGIGLYLIPFDYSMAKVRLIDQQPEPDEVLLEFDARRVVQGFCLANPENPNCVDFEPTDVDNDGVIDIDDNCVNTPNEDQADANSDGVGDACEQTGDPDGDGDGVPDAVDNCPDDANPDQADTNEDGVGDACDSSSEDDSDGDGVLDTEDFCPNTMLPERIPESGTLKPNRWAATTAEPRLLTSASSGSGARSVSLSDTAGCTCEQIVDARGLGKGHRKWGCSTGVLNNWVRSLTP